MILKRIREMSIYTFCTILFLVAGMTSGNIVSAGGIDKIYVSDASGNTGDRTIVSVNATNMNDVGSLQFDLQYDKNVLTAENVTAGDAMLREMFTSNIKNTGVTVGIINVTGISGSGSIANIAFNVIGATGTSSPLTISMTSPTDSKNNQINVQNIGNATFTVGNIAVIGTVSPTVGVSPAPISTPTPVPTGMIPNSDNGSGGDSGVRNSGRNGGASSGDPSNVGTKSGETSTPTETQKVATTKESTVPTKKVPEEGVISKETTAQKTTGTDTNPKSPGLGIVSSIAILSLIYIFERKERK